MGERNYQRICDAYSWEKITDQYQHLFLDEDIFYNLSKKNQPKKIQWMGKMK
jgi:hypothetical protein